MFYHQENCYNFLSFSSRQVNIYWVKDEKIYKGSRVHDDGSVFIRKVKLQDSGDYECYSKDEARLLFGSVKLKVIGKYRISSQTIKG